MEKFKKSEKIEEESLVNDVKNELLTEKEIQLKNRDAKEHYRVDYENLDVNTVGIEEAKLWQKMKDVKDKDEYDQLADEFRSYRSRINKEIENDVEGGKYESITHPKNQFISILGNRINQLMEKFME